MRTIVSVLLTIALATAASPAARAQSENNLTFYGGYRFGGGFTDVTTGKSWDATEGPAYSIAADFALEPQKQLEIFVSHRKGELQAKGFAPAVASFGLDITYLHVGGTYFFDQQVGRGGYVVGGLGLTNFSPGLSGLNSETRFSLNVGVGYMVPLSQHLALKVEGRGYATLINSSSAFFCSGGCVVQIKGDTFTQAEVMAGIAARF